MMIVASFFNHSSRNDVETLSTRIDIPFPLIARTARSAPSVVMGSIVLCGIMFPGFRFYFEILIYSDPPNLRGRCSSSRHGAVSKNATSLQHFRQRFPTKNETMDD